MWDRWVALLCALGVAGQCVWSGWRLKKQRGALAASGAVLLGILVVATSIGLLLFAPSQ